MKGLKCFGLLLLLFIMVGLSLNVSSDVNALKYQVDTIPFLIPESPQNNYISNGSISILYDPFRIRFYDPDDIYTSKEYWYYKLQPNSDFSACDFYRNQGFIRVNNKYISTNSSTNEYQYTDLHFRLPYYDSRLISLHGNSVSEEFFHCNSDGVISNPGISTRFMPNYILGNPDGRSWLPYRYDVSGAFRAFTRNDDGRIVGTKFDLSELFDYGSNRIGVPPDKIFYMDIPLGVRSPSSDLTGGSHIKLNFRIYLDADDPSQTPDIGLNNTEVLTVKTTPVSFDYTTPGQINIPCSSMLFSNPVETEAPYYIDYVCEGDIPTLLPDSNPLLFGFTLKLHGDPYLWDYPGTRFVLFDLFTITTNYDETPASEPFGREIDGGNVSSAPGYLSDGADTSANTDWFYSLTQMFKFDFINPFAPLFNMFAGSDDCANISTLSSMLHAEETQVCHWFPSEVRAIVTPVLSIVGMMIIFGFTVRWLGSSSGNMFEDQTSHKWSNTQFKQKGVK